MLAADSPRAARAVERLSTRLAALETMDHAAFRARTRQTFGKALRPEEVAARIIADPEVSIAVETVGGATFAVDLMKRLLAAGKDVVTANKAALAKRGPELFEAARRAGRSSSFEASVAAGIPIIRALR
ncbi:MAG: homoserine dehydrogenase, partial [Planctomycetota bacterium]|nr:homoserine dehydrogenase [Planctomycetota bacterium]